MKFICLFDLDGTLTDPKAGITKSVSHALKSFGIFEPDLDELTKFIGPPLRDSFRMFYGFSEAEAEAAVSKYREYFSETGIFENALYDGILEMLEHLKTSGIQMVIATSKPTVYAERIAARFGFKQYFDFIAGSELDGTRSRKSEVIEYALQNITMHIGERAFMIGDREHDIIGAKLTRLGSIGVTWGYGSLSELTAAGADRIVNYPAELIAAITDISTPRDS